MGTLFLLALFLIYLYFFNGHLYIKSKHFEINLKADEIKQEIHDRTKPENNCKNCNKPISKGETLCEECLKKDLELYSSINVNSSSDDN